MTTTYPRETIEFLPVTVTLGGNPITSGVTLSLNPQGTRPTAWIAPTVIGPEIGVMLTGLTPGWYTVWARVASSPETPVIECGTFRVS